MDRERKKGREGDQKGPRGEIRASGSLLMKPSAPLDKGSTNVSEGGGEMEM